MLYIISFLIFLITLYIYRLLHKSHIYIKLKSYIVLHCEPQLTDYTLAYSTSKLDGNSLNIKYCFKNSTYMYINFDYSMNYFITYTFNDNMDIASINKHTDDTFINYYDMWGIYGFYKKYIDINVKIKNYDDINMIKIKNIPCNNTPIINITKSNVSDYIVDFIESNYDLYNQFVNMVNDCDKPIIKIGSFGISGSGKTYFLNNIIKIISHNKNDLCGVIENFYIHLYDLLNNNKLTYETKLDKIERHFYRANCLSFKIIYLDLDNPYINEYLDDIIKIINNMKLYTSKLIFLFDSYDSKYMEHFDIVYKGDYLTEYQINKLNDKLNDKINSIDKINKNVKKKQTINNVITDYITTQY